MAQRCGNCHGDGIFEGRRCHCLGPAKRFFPKQAAKKKAEGYAFKTAHRHDFKFVHTNMVTDWFLCDCGETKKVALSN